MEDSIPTGAKTGTSKAIPPRDIVEYVSQGELQMSCLKLARSDKKVLINSQIMNTVPVILVKMYGYLSDYKK